MQRIVPCSLALLLAPTLALAGPSADGGRVYTGGRGEQVTLVQLKPVEAHDYLCRITGSASPLDGVALPCKHTVDGNHEYYTTAWRGRDFSFVQMDRRGDRWELFVPGELGRARPLTLDAALTKALKPKDVVSQYDKQLKDGTLARFASFHRDEEQAEVDRSFARTAAQAAKACGAPIAATIDWATVDDATLKHLSIESFCGPPLSTLAALCSEAPSAAAMLRDKVKAVRCRFLGPMKLQLAAGQLDWTVDADAANAEEFARKSLEDLDVAEPIANAGPQKPPWGDARTLGQRLALARTTVCTDGRNHFAVLAPHAETGNELYYGDAQTLHRVPVDGLLGAGMFFEPRFVNPTANPSFRGADVRLFSSIDYDEQKHRCVARCGTRDTPLTVLDGKSALALLTAASWQPPVQQHVPHALTRDDKGIYYYVDKGATPETAKRFRMFMGAKGNLKLQQMINVVSDSQGEIFSTKRGQLRFIVGPKGSESTWVQGTRRVRLLAVPIEENWSMIYNDLGVYSGERRGTPCDDL